MTVEAEASHSLPSEAGGSEEPGQSSSLSLKKLRVSKEKVPVQDQGKTKLSKTASKAKFSFPSNFCFLWTLNELDDCPSTLGRASTSLSLLIQVYFFWNTLRDTPRNV